MLRTRAVALAALCMFAASVSDGAGLRAADLRIVSSTGHVPLLRRLVDAWAAGREGITAEVRPGPKQISRETEIDLRLSTGGMGDLFTYSAGALFRAIQFRGRLVDLTWLPLQRRVDPAFTAVVSADGRIFGVPLGGASVGGILYNRRLYAELGLTEPESWARFMENNRKIAAAGRIPVDFPALYVDYMSLSAHKAAGPQGVGALVSAPALASARRTAVSVGDRPGPASGSAGAPSATGAGNSTPV